MTDEAAGDFEPEETGGRHSATGVDRKMLESLVCPVSQKPLDYDRERMELISRTAGLAFPIRDGIPIMLVEEARQID